MEILSITISVVSLFSMMTGLVITYKKIIKDSQSVKEQRFTAIEQRLIIIENTLEEQRKTQMESNKLQKEEQKSILLKQLRSNILLFGERVRLYRKLSSLELGDHWDISEDAYLLIFEEYERYKALGGNGFIKVEMDYIEKNYKKLRTEE